MHGHRDTHFFAIFCSLALHAAVLALVGHGFFSPDRLAKAPKAQEKTLVFTLLPDPAAVLPQPIQPIEPAAKPAPRMAVAPAIAAAPVSVPLVDTGSQAAQTAAAAPAADRPRASLAAPPAPSAQEWAFAAKYTHKNSKGYRYHWGQQVRSMMGTAVEGPDQGLVRFRIEIAPDGRLATLQTLWSTSDKAEQLARQAIANLPTLPPTPTGQPLIFEKTISFSPFASDAPPLYKDDCLPDPPVFRNPFAWDGRSPQRPAQAAPTEKPDPQALAECLRQLPQDSIDAESAYDQRQMERWGTGQRTP